MKPQTKRLMGNTHLHIAQEANEKPNKTFQ